MGAGSASGSEQREGDRLRTVNELQCVCVRVKTSSSRAVVEMVSAAAAHLFFSLVSGELLQKSTLREKIKTVIACLEAERTFTLEIYFMLNNMKFVWNFLPS